MFIDKKVKFNHESNYLDSVYVFEDGDFILFGAIDKSLGNPFDDKKKSTLYDGKTLKPKLLLNVSSLCSFFNLMNDEFAICHDLSYFELFKFNSDRTSYDKIQTFSDKEGGSPKIINQMPNLDICISRVYVGYSSMFIFRKNETNPKFAPYGENFVHHLEDIEEIISLNDTEALGYKIFKGSESLVLELLNINDYKLIRKNKINFMEGSARKRLYISLPIYKMKNKLITASTKCFYIIGIDTLELETTIQFEKFILQILIRPKENIFLLCRSREKKYYPNRDGTESSHFYYDQYIKNIKIDFETNDIIEIKEEDITQYCGRNKELFHLYNYINNGIITLVEKSKIIFYEDFDD